MFRHQMISTERVSSLLILLAVILHPCLAISALNKPRTLILLYEPFTGLVEKPGACL
jgi:hypothetical protein